jgi:small subunit ribosomal protein S1
MAVDQNSGKWEPPVQINTEDYEHLLDDYSHFVPPSEGEVLQGKVLKVTATEVIVDFGSKSEGLVPIEQFRQPGGEIRYSPEM